MAGHIDASRSNGLIGGILGAVADVFVTYTTGLSTGGRYADLGASIGSAKYSQQFEAEADYIGLYLLERAGLNAGAAPEFWRGMAIANPTSISIATSHPTTAERFVRLDRALTEVAGKKARGLAMLPEGDFDWAARSPDMEPQNRVALAEDPRTDSLPVQLDEEERNSGLVPTPAEPAPPGGELLAADTAGAEEAVSDDPAEQLQTVPAYPLRVPGFSVRLGLARPMHPAGFFEGPWSDGMAISLAFEAAIRPSVVIRVEGTHARFPSDQAGLTGALGAKHQGATISGNEETAQFFSGSVGPMFIGNRGGTVQPKLFIGGGVGLLRMAWIPLFSEQSYSILPLNTEWGPLIKGGVAVGFHLGSIILEVGGEYDVLITNTGNRRGHPHFLSVHLGLSSDHTRRSTSN